MGSIIQNAANNISANGIFSSSALNNASLSGISALPSGVGGKLKLLSTATASSSASISFTSGIDSTYDIYKFEYVGLHPQNDVNIHLYFQASTNGGSSYGVTTTNTHLYANHSETDAFAFVNYDTGEDLAQSTSNITLAGSVGGSADESASGELYLFQPSSTTYVKHYIARGNAYYHGDGASHNFTAGYFNTTTALNGIKFLMSSGNIDAGTIKMYGISA